MSASFEGMLFQDKTLHPVVLMIVADQPQERLFFSLKKADSYADCSLCLMPSRVRAAHRLDANIEIHPEASHQQKRRKKNAYIASGAELLSNEDGSQSSVLEQNASKTLTQQHIRQGSGIEVNEVDETSQEPVDVQEQILKVQTAQAGYEKRDVEKILQCQLFLAFCKRNKEQSRGNIALVKKKRAKAYLEIVSAQEYPPALAAFNGLGSKPFQLYRSIAFDKLHSFDLGPLRQNLIPDTVYKVLQKAGMYENHSRTEYVNILNQRMLDVPRSACLERNTPFRANSTEKHAGMSGKIRQSAAPVLWYCVMGLASGVDPDEDKLLQVCLMWDYIHRELCEINRSRKKMMRTADDIKKLQRCCFEAGKLTTEVLRVPVNMKLHRLMRHVGDHLFDFGDIRKGDTDRNEAMHKDTKRAYRATNHHLTSIVPQLLSARVHISCEIQLPASEISRLEAQILLNREINFQYPSSQATPCVTGGCQATATGGTIPDMSDIDLYRSEKSAKSSLTVSLCQLQCLVSEKVSAEEVESETSFST